MKPLFTILMIMLLSNGQTQFVATGAYKALAISSPENYYKTTVTAWNSNDTYDYYYSHNHINLMAYNFSLRSFGKQFFSEKKFVFGYSLEIGLQHFTSSAQLQYDHSSTDYHDSIVNALDGYRYKTNYSNVFFNHYVDFHYRINEDMKFTASIGFGINALMRAKSANVPNSSIIDADYPVTANIIFEPQLIEKYEKFDIGYFISWHVYSLALYNWKDNDFEYGDNRFKLSDLRFNGLGLRFIPHLKDHSKIRLEDD